MSDRPTGFHLSRRRVLAGLGGIGVASAGAGLGTSALFSDTESFEGNTITAGTLDLLVGYYSYWDQGMAGEGSVSGTADGEAVSADLSDVKPGDSGLVAFCPQIETNPAYLWLAGELTDSSENDYTEPEPVDDNGEGELEENVDVEVNYCTVDDDVGDGFDPGDVETVATAWSGTLAEFLATSETGIALDGDASVPQDGSFPEPGDQACFDGSDAEGENYCLCLDWEVPTSVGNEIQGDSLEFDLQFYAEQCRNNDGANNPYRFANDPWLDNAQTGKCGVFWNHPGEDNEFALEPGDTFDGLPSPGQPIYVNTTDEPIDIAVDDGNSGTSVTLGVGAYDGSDFHEVGSGAPWVRIPTGAGTPHPQYDGNHEFVGIEETEGGCEVTWAPVNDE